MSNHVVKPRLQWVDTAKGLCILLVILYHTTEHIMDLCPVIRDMLRAARMPLYYTIAGLFVSVKNPKVFLNKKFNRLVIPFCFFVLLGDLGGYLTSIADGTDFTYFSPLYYAITEDTDRKFFNPPIWFLISLLDVYIIYMFIERIAKHAGKYDALLKMALALLAGFCGIRCNRMCIDLPFFIDTSLTATPFFIFGHIMMTKTDILKKNYSRHTYLILSVILIGIALLTANGDIEYYRNNIRATVFHTYVPGVLGSTGLLLLAKAIGSIPVITNIGRYSIVYLGTHYLFFRELKELFEPILGPHHEIWLDVWTFSSTVVLSAISCWLLLKSVPFLVAQKDAVHFGSFSEKKG